MIKKRSRKLSTILGTYFVVSIFFLSSVILYWTYHSATKAIHIELQKSFEQRYSIMENIIEQEAERIESAIHAMVINDKFLSEIRNNQLSQAQKILEQNVERSEQNRLDVLFISKTNTPVWLDVSSPVPNVQPLLEKISLESRKLLATANIVRFKNNSADLTGIFKSEKIVSDDGEVLGIIVGGTILNDNLLLLNKIRQKTKSSVIILLEDRNIIASTTSKDLNLFKEIGNHPDQGDLHFEDIFSKIDADSLISTHYKIQLHNTASSVNIVFSKDNDVLVKFKKLYLNTLVVITTVFIIFLFLTLLVIRRLIYPSIGRMLDYTRKIALGNNHHISLEPGAIAELNTIGFAMEKMVDSINKSKSKLQSSEERYRLITENIADIIWTVDMDLKFTYISPSIYQLRGYTVEEAMKQTLKEVLHYDSLEKTMELFINTLALIESGNKEGFNPIEFEVQQTCKDGSIIWTSNNARILHDSDNQPVSILGITHNITERKRAEELLRESESKYRRLTENAKAMIYRQSLPDGRYEYINAASVDITGYTPEEIRKNSMHIRKTIHPDWRKYIEEQWEHLQKGKVLPFYEYQIIHKSGEIKWINQRNVLVYDKKGSLIATEGILTDETLHKQTEQEKIKAQKIAGDQKKLALVGQVAGKIAHDFNNILGIIMGNTELSLMDCKDVETRKTLELIFEQTLRGKNLTRNLVAFAKDQEPKQEFFRINEKIDLVLNLMKKDLKGIKLIKDNAPDVPDLLADPGMIEHAFVNLIQNSIHAISLVEYPEIIIRTYRFDNKICFEIEDNGCGISEKYIENIFEPSFTLKGSKDIFGSYKTGIKGTGYGMANVKKYIEQHKGNISIESELESGTKFTISLPIIEKGLTNKEKAEIREGKAPLGKYILLVEDEQAISDVQYRILTQEPCSHKVDTAYNGKVAMDLIAKNKYDLVSLDYVLPGDINGMNVYHFIRATNKTIPILFISGNIEFLESIKDLKQKDTYIDHLSKPCQNKDYVNSINNLIEKSLLPGSY